MSPVVLSVVLSLVSAVSYAGAAVLQERVAATSASLRSRGWFASVALNGAGGVLHVVALAYGPLSVVQPLGALTIVFAVPMAVAFGRRPVGGVRWQGAALATAGLAGVLALSGADGSESPSAAERVGLVVVTVGAVGVAALVARKLRRVVVRGVLLAGAAGGVFGVSSVFVKAVAEDWELGSSIAVLAAEAGVIALLAIVGLLLSQASYRGAGLAAPLATVTVVNPVVATVVGVALLGEGFRYGTLGTLLAIGAAALAGCGLVVLTAERVERPGARFDGPEATLPQVSQVSPVAPPSPVTL